MYFCLLINNLHLFIYLFFSSFQRQRKMQNERLRTEFSDALNNFQTVQRTVAEKERASVSRARAHSGYGVAVSIFLYI